MGLLGSCDRAAELASRELLAQGCTNLEAKIGSHIAAFGENCWQTDRTLREVLLRRDGEKYHRESIGRARRTLARAGFIKMKRVFPGQRPKGAEHISAHGTTSKMLRWDRLGVANPVSRRDRAIQQAQQQAQQRREYFARAQHSAPVPSVAYSHKAVEVDPELDKVLEDFRRTQQERAARVDANVGSSPSPKANGRGPPDT